MTWDGSRLKIDTHLPVSAAFTLSLTCLLCGCGEAGGPADNSLETLPDLVAEEEIRIGDRDDPDYGFSRVYSLDVGEDGNVFVLESLVPEIRVYSPEGTLLRRIGKRGEGPGEFQGGPSFGVLGDTLWTVDRGLNRITIFDLGGDVLSTGTIDQVMVPLPSSFATVRPWAMRPDGMFISAVSGVRSSRRDPPTGVTATDSIPTPFLLYDATGSVTDTIGWAERPPPRFWRPPSEYRMEMRSIEIAGRQQFVPGPPSGLPWWLNQLDGYLLVETPLAEAPGEGVLTLTRIGLVGDTVFSRDLFYDPIPYSDADLDSIAARGARGEAGGMLPFFTPGASPPDNWKAIANRLRAEMDFPEFQMPIEYPFGARDGSVWLRWQDADSPEARWVLFDPQGRPRGVLTLPLDYRILWSQGDIFWAVDPDEYDVPWLVRFRIRPG